MRAAIPTVALAPDPAVPGRDVLLDPAEMADRLSVLMGADGPLDIDRYDRGRVKYRVGGSLRVVHEIDVAGERRIVASRTFGRDRAEEVYERALETARPAGPLRGVAYDPDLEAVFWTFPNDRKIATLPALVPGTDAVSRLLGRPIARTARSAVRGSSMRRITSACARGSSSAIRSNHSRTSGTICTGGCLRSSVRSTSPSRRIAPPFTPSAPWPPAPRIVARSQQICFSATWIG